MLPCHRVKVFHKLHAERLQMLQCPSETASDQELHMTSSRAEAPSLLLASLIRRQLQS